MQSKPESQDYHMTAGLEGSRSCYERCIPEGPNRVPVRDVFPKPYHMVVGP